MITPVELFSFMGSTGSTWYKPCMKVKGHLRFRESQIKMSQCKVYFFNVANSTIESNASLKCMLLPFMDSKGIYYLKSAPVIGKSQWEWKSMKQIYF